MKQKLLLPISILLTLAIVFSQCASLDTASGSLSRFAFSASDSTSALLKSLSTSVSSVSDSISSETKGEKESAYRQDVKSSIVLFHKHPATQIDMENDLAMIAKEHGIPNWKNNANTYLGIGQGLKAASASQKEFDMIIDRVAENNLAMANLLKEGYLSLK